MDQRRASLVANAALLKGNGLVVQDENAESNVVAASRGSIKGLQEKKHDNKFDESQILSSVDNATFIMNAMLVAANTVKVAACEGESQYISIEISKNMAINEQINEEDLVCKEKLENIRTKWQTLLSCKAPQELAQRISEQCKACDDVIKNKNDLIALIRGELRSVDEDYHRMFRQQLKDVNALITSMSTQAIDLHNTHIEELSKIESNLMEQRKDLLMRNKAEIETLLKNVRTKEFFLKENLLKRMEDYTKSLDTIRIQDSEDYNLLKVRLETDVQTLEQHLESMAAAYQLNTEKLDYNYAVLVERDHDNYVTASQQKRKLTKQRDTLGVLKARHSDFEKRFLLQNAKLANDYEKIIKLLQDLQSKENQLKDAQERQYWEFLHMHHHALSVVASKLLQADKMIHEQQLGWVWHSPSTDLFSSFETYISFQKKSHAMMSEPNESTCDGKDKDTARHPSISEIGKIWRSYSSLVSPKVLHVWAALGSALLSYNQLLKSRAKLMYQVHTLAQQKDLLERALEQSMCSKVSLWC